MPKNLHYLTDRLPKPNYMIEMRNSFKNNTLKDEPPVYSGGYSLNAGSLPKISHIGGDSRGGRVGGGGGGGLVGRKVVKTKIVHMNINPIVERPEHEYQRYKRSPIRQHQPRNISLPPLLK